MSGPKTGRAHEGERLPNNEHSTFCAITKVLQELKSPYPPEGTLATSLVGCPAHPGSAGSNTTSCWRPSLATTQLIPCDSKLLQRTPFPKQLTSRLTLMPTQLTRATLKTPANLSDAGTPLLRKMYAKHVCSPHTRKGRFIIRAAVKWLRCVPSRRTALEARRRWPT